MALGLGSWEIIVLGLALLILFGPEHAPQAIRTLGRWQRKIRDTVGEIEQTLEEETKELDESEEAAPLFGPRDQVPPEAETWTFTDTPDEEEGHGSGSEEDPEPDEERSGR